MNTATANSAQPWPLSHQLIKRNGVCSVCFATRQIHISDGFIHLHGPRSNPCEGSNKPPLLSSVYASQPISSSTQAGDVLRQTTVVPLIDVPIAVEPRIDLCHTSVLGSIIKHIPKSARHHCASQLKSVIDNIVSKPEDLHAWSNLFNFGNTMLLAPPRGGKKHNLTSIIKNRLATDALNIPSDNQHQAKNVRRKAKNERSLLSALVSSKIDDGNIKAALRILSSSDTPASDNDLNVSALRSKHPSAAPGRGPLPVPDNYVAIQISDADIVNTIRSFPSGSAGGPDGLRPQHFLDLINNKEAGPSLITAITRFVNMLLSGKCHPDVIPVLFGGSLIALEKKSGGIRPIAIGYTLRRIAAKCANKVALASLGDKLLPEQLGLGTPGGCEAAVHATRRYLSDMPEDFVVAKLDFCNAFNSVHRDTMLNQIADLVPEIYKFCHIAYSTSTHLKFFNHIILSDEGAQQGDPLGPLLFCLSIHPLLRACRSQLKIAYMDDITLGGPASVVADDVNYIRSHGAHIGLLLNDKKCEAISKNGLSSSFETSFIQLEPMSATLLGAPLLKGWAMDDCLAKHCGHLKTAISRLELITSHDALVLLRASFSAPKLQHTLRSAPCTDHPLLNEFDQSLRSALIKVCNIALSDDQWLQASLPVRCGGLGIRRVSSLASSAFIASAVGTRNLQNQILHFNTLLPDIEYDSCLSQWRNTNILQHLPDQPSKQRSWDGVVVDREFSVLMQHQTDDYNKARLLAASAKHSGDWLHAIPITSCGLRLDNEAIRIAVGLRLGSDICQPHTCICGAMADVRGCHALTCKRSSGRIIRHNYLNDIILRSLTRASIPATREPLGLLRSDGKRPDGLTMIPWREGRCLVWDVTVAATTAASYLPSTAVCAGSAAESATVRKESKYRDLVDIYEFVPIAVESMGPINSKATAFLSDLGRRMALITNDSRETSFLFQRLSVALQRFNAVCIADTFKTLDFE